MVIARSRVSCTSCERVGVLSSPAARPAGRRGASHTCREGGADNMYERSGHGGSRGSANNHRGTPQGMRPCEAHTIACPECGRRVRGEPKWLQREARPVSVRRRVVGVTRAPEVREREPENRLPLEIRVRCGVMRFCVSMLRYVRTRNPREVLERATVRRRREQTARGDTHTSPQPSCHTQP